MRLILFAIVNLVLLAGAAVADPSATPPPSQVTIEARQEELKGRVSAFVGDVMSQDAGSLGEPIAVWNWPLCFSVSGLPKEDAVYVLNRISKDAEMVGAPLAKDERGCHPNFVVIVTAEPEKVLRAWYHHDQLIYNCAFPMPVNEFVGRPQPVRVWYNSDLSLALPGPPGAVDPAHAAHSLYRRCGRTPIAGGRLGTSRTTYGLVPDFLSVLMVVDLKRVNGYQWSQVADYMALSGLAKINRQKRDDDAPTILNLFSFAGPAAPQELTGWDRAFLKALYNTDQRVAGERVAVVDQMLKSIKP
jgi:hypothetical protein